MATHLKSNGSDDINQESSIVLVTSTSPLDDNPISTSSRSLTTPLADKRQSTNTSSKPKFTINIGATNSSNIDSNIETPTSVCTRSPPDSATIFNPASNNNYTMVEGNNEETYADINVAEAIIRKRCKRRTTSLFSRLKHKLGLCNIQAYSTKSRKPTINANDRNDNRLLVNGTYIDIDIDDNDDGSQEETGVKIPLPHTSIDPVPPSNAIRTSRYTIFNFVPRQLVAQFSKVANLYFLFISVLEQIPDLATTGRYVTILPLSIFIAIAMIHEAYDDFCRYRMDKVENERKCQVLRIYRNRSTVCASSSPSEVKSTSSANVEERKQEDAPPIDDIIIDSRMTCVWQEIRWRQLAVGDIVRIKQDDWIPADLLLLHSSLDDNICYVETAALDGETNLKEMRVPEALCDQTSTPEQIAELSGYVQAEDPNDDLYDFNGCIHFYSRKTSMENKQKEQLAVSSSSSTINLLSQTSNVAATRKFASESKVHLSLLSRSSLDTRNLLLRGTILRNTTDVYGMVIYSGENTKIRQNALKNARTKAPMLQRHVNRAVISVFILLLVLASLMTAMQSVWLKSNNTEYLPHDYSTGSIAVVFFGFTVLLNTVIPISLYVVLEMVKVVQAYLIGQDMEMYDPVSDTPAEARTSAINEDLGQVRFVFSDKTGTLTENVMEFRACSVAGVAYRNTSTEEDGSCPLPMSTAVSSILTSRAITHIESDEWWFLRALSLCHSVVPSIQSDPTTGAEMAINYQSPSPDEHALVSGARDFGFELRERQGQHVRIHIKADATTLASTSATHDTALATSAIGSPVLDVGTNALPSPAISLPPDMLSLQHNNGKDGRHIPEEYEVLDELAFSSRRKRMSVVYRSNTTKSKQVQCQCQCNDKEEEHDASHQDTAVAKQTLYHLDQFAQVGLRTLVYAYRFLDPDEYTAWHKQYVDAQSAITDRVQRMESVMSLIERPNPATGEGLRMCGITAVEDRLQPVYQKPLLHYVEQALVITISGESDHHGSNDTSKPDEQSDAALAVREQLINARDSLPLVTRSTLFKRKKKNAKNTLIRDGTGVLAIDAIGDGGNDIAMIQEAHVGIGITGREGLQAARASDYMHGRWSYVRVSKFTLGTFYKTVAFYVTQAYFQAFAGFSGTSLYEQWALSLYNTIFCALPVIILGTTEQDLSASTLMRVPELYRMGHANAMFNLRRFWSTMFFGMTQPLA
ncbi:hypothetical protein BDF22DRAFT_653773 [Syncephalis plumigaleata]|nr:hypothetical protein BDF22DRAFT_653773 [Syncephalis plumigaleata]